MQVRLLMDNLTAAHYNMGGTKSPVLALLALDLWEWCPHHNILIEAQCLPGVLNIRVDRESRLFLDHHNWQLDPLLFSELNQVWGPLEVDLFASRLSTQLPRFYSWRPDPCSEAVYAFSQDWSKVRGYAFPFLCSSRPQPQAVTRPSCVTSRSSGTSLAVSAMVPSASRVVCSTSHSVPSLPGPAKTRGGSPSFVEPSTGRLGAIRQSYSEAGISQPAQTLLVVVWRDVTSKAYASAWRRWASWCRERKLNSVQASVESILEFLASEFNLGRANRTLNVYRSAISSTHPKIDSVRVGEHPLVVQLLKGAYNLRPPLPRYSSTWDASLVVSFIVGLGNNESLSLTDLS